MAKFNMQQFLLAKGEKIGLGLAVGGLGLLGIWGISNLVSAKNPKTVSDSFGKYAKDIDSKMKNATGVGKELPPYLQDVKSLDLRAIDPDAFPVNYAFEPVDFPSRARDNPKVLGIKEAQLDLVRLNMKAYDIQGSPGSYTIGILEGVNIQGDKVDSKSMRDIFKKSDPRKRAQSTRPPQNTPGFSGVPPGATPPPGGGSGGGPPPGMMMPPGGMAGAGGDMNPYGPNGLNSGAVYENKNRIEKTVKRKDIENFDPAKDTPAFVIYPRRTIVMHAVFPLKEQLEVIRRALRLKTIDEAARETSSTPGLAGSTPGGPPPGMAMPAGGSSRDISTPPGTSSSGGPPTATTAGGGVKVPEGPTFAGFEVERQIIDPNGRVYDWHRYDHVGWYLAEINNRKVADQPDEGYLPYFLRYDQEMAMPLPAVADGQQTYPPITLPSIIQTVQKMKDSQKVPLTPTELQQRFNGKGSSPFLPSFLPPAGGGAAGAGEGFFGNQGGSMGLGSSGGRGGMMMPLPPGATGVPPGVPGVPPGYPQPGPGGFQPGGGVLQEIKAAVELEHMLIRFMDVAILPGHTYEYRIRVKMKNPNYGVKNVSRPSDAEVPILYGPWVGLSGADGKPLQVTVPIDLNTYLVDPVQYKESIRTKYRDQRVVKLLDNDNGKLPVIEVQQWLSQVAIDELREPIGAWVVGDIPVSRGEFIGKKQLTTLPMWSSQKVRYILQELPKYKVNPTAKEQPKGLLVDFTTSNICVDYEGGLQVRPLPDRNLEDDGAVEMLILNADGTLKVRNSGVDMQNADRLDRAKRWEDWIEKVKADTAAAGALGAQPTDSGFGTPGTPPGKN